MLAPLNLAQKNFPINIIQGPLAGISSAPFRELTWRYSQPAFSCTEMISCKTLLHQSKYTYQRFIQKAPKEGPVCFQLSSNNPRELGEAVKFVTDQGADLIDLNCGCPVKKIRSKGAGSSLLTNPSLLYQLLIALKQNTHLPVSIKIRVEGRSPERFHRELCQVISDAGIDSLIVHGRHWTEHYETPCHYEHIAYFVEALKIPVIGNGDIHCLDSLRTMYATGCAGVMIARAGLGQPWLIRQLASALKGEDYAPPSSQEIGAVFLEHVLKLTELLRSEHIALEQARKFGKYYARNVPNKSVFISLLNQCQNLNELAHICQTYFSQTEQ